MRRGRGSQRRRDNRTRSVRTTAWVAYRTQEELEREASRESAGAKPLRGKVKMTFSLRLEIPEKGAGGVRFPTAPAAKDSPPPNKVKIRISYHDLSGWASQKERLPGRLLISAGARHGRGRSEWQRGSGIGAIRSLRFFPFFLERAAFPDFVNYRVHEQFQKE